MARALHEERFHFICSVKTLTDEVKTESSQKYSGRGKGHIYKPRHHERAVCCRAANVRKEQVLNHCQGVVSAALHNRSRAEMARPDEMQ